jgi:single-strand DNA-binding protein
LHFSQEFEHETHRYGPLGQRSRNARIERRHAVLNLSLAVNYGKKGQDGNRPTQWIEAAMFGQRAETLAPFMLKSSAHCFTLSDMHIETYVKGDGSQGVKLAARVDDVELGPRQDGAAHAQRQAQARPAPAPRQAPPPRQAMPPASSSGFDDMDDDIPFVSCDWALEIDTSKAKRMRRYDY